MPKFKKEKILEISKIGLDFEIKIPAGTTVESIEQGIALMIIDTAKYRNIKTSTYLGEISQWVQQLEEHL